MDQQLHSDELLSQNTAVGLYKNKSLNKCEKLRTLLLYTYYFTCSTCYVILSHILHKKSTFRHAIAPNVNRAHAPLLLAEKLRRG